MDNSDVNAKVKIREWVIGELGGIKQTRVLDLFGGQGLMYRKCYTEAARHLAFDLKAHPHENWVIGNNRLLLPQYVNDGFNLYDADAYSNPWIIIGDVCRLRAKGTFGVVATCGMWRGLQNNTNAYIRQKAGFGGIKSPRPVAFWYDDIIRWIIDDYKKHGVIAHMCKRMRRRTINQRGDYRGPEVYYYGLLMHKK